VQPQPCRGEAGHDLADLAGVLAAADAAEPDEGDGAQIDACVLEHRGGEMVVGQGPSLQDGDPRHLRGERHQLQIRFQAALLVGGDVELGSGKNERYLESPKQLP